MPNVSQSTTTVTVIEEPTATDVITIMPQQNSYTITPLPPHMSRSRVDTSASVLSNDDSQYDLADDKKQAICGHCHDILCRDDACLKSNGHGTWKESLKHRWRNLLRPVLKSSHAAPPPNAGWFQQLRHDLLLPTSGIVARLITLAFLAFFIWAAFWSVLRNDMLPVNRMIFTQNYSPPFNIIHNVFKTAIFPKKISK